MCGASAVASFAELGAGNAKAVRPIVAEMQARLDQARVKSASPGDIARCALRMAVVNVRLAENDGDSARASRVAREAVGSIAIDDRKFGPIFEPYVSEILLAAGERAKAAARADRLYALRFRHPEFMKLRLELAPRTGADGAQAGK